MKKNLASVAVPVVAILAAMLLSGLLARSANAAITLLYYQANVAAPDIGLEWATGTELDTAGFYIGRGTSAAGPFTHLPSPDDSTGFIPHQGDGVTGATYVLTDTTVQPGVTYYYRLETLDIHNGTTYFGPISATIEGEVTVYGVKLSPISSAQTGWTGSVVTYSLQLTNTGNITDTFTPFVDYPVTFVPTTIISLPASAGTNVQMVMTLPLTTTVTVQDLLVGARSEGDVAHQSNYVHVVTTITPYAAYLPVVLR